MSNYEKKILYYSYILIYYKKKVYQILFGYMLFLQNNKEST